MSGDVMTEFEVFKRIHSPAMKPPAVTLTQRGQLSLNEAAYTELGSPKAVELMYSREDRVIGMRAVDPAEPHAYIPRTPAKQKGRRPYIISCTTFLRHFGIVVGPTARHMVTVRDGILTVDLKKPGIQVARAMVVANRRRSLDGAARSAVRVREALAVLGDDAPPLLAETGRLRVAHPRMNLTRLGQLTCPVLSKDTVAGRLRRLCDLADRSQQVQGGETRK